MNPVDVVFCDCSPSSSVENYYEDRSISSCSLFSLSQNRDLLARDVVTSPPPSIHTLSPIESLSSSRRSSISDVNFDDGGDFGDLGDLLNHLRGDDFSHNDLSDLTLGVTYIYYLSKCEEDELGLSSRISIKDIMNAMDTESCADGNSSTNFTARFITSIFAPIFANFSGNDRLDLLHKVIKRLRPDIVDRGEVSDNACLKFFRDVKYERTTCGRLTRMCCVILFHNILQDWISIGVCRWMSEYNLDSWSLFRLIGDFFRKNCCR
ncbi:hypothetical protein [Candidatus Ichthyocystis hellenicum]|uniref:hypothetical protein n=1 Tax=Candidatus Ichthyocystis hellenicum TaxID=1561003 RepID=UPI000B872FFE|nr:hypothetical protein [Candidatus Ichthyocystis hellenicum]